MNQENSYDDFDFSEQVLSQQEAKGLLDVQRKFLESYAAAKKTMTVDEWLSKELKSQLPEKTDAEINSVSAEILKSLRVTESQKESLQKAVEAGRDKESWFATSILQSTSQMSAQESAVYLNKLDAAVRNANEEMYRVVTTKAGATNQQWNLDGFIAEQYHANTYNLKAQATGADTYAEVLVPRPGERYHKNSVDVVIKDSNGKIVKRYQLKYGKTAEDTIKLIKRGDYRGQQLIVPADQVEAVQKAFPDRKVSAIIGEGDVTSKPLTKAEVKELQEQAQRGNFLNTDWSDYAAKDIARGIGKQVCQASLQGAAIGAGMNIVGKVWNGEPIDGEEVVKDAIVSGADFGVKAATAGALKTAVEYDVIDILPKDTPGSTYANIAFVAVENIKVVGKVATGELTPKEGLDTMEQTTVACVSGLNASAIGADVGAVVGSVLGPVGTTIGGFLGGTLGYMAGSTVAKNVVKGMQKVRDAAISCIKSGMSTLKNSFRSMFRKIFA